MRVNSVVPGWIRADTSTRNLPPARHADRVTCIEVRMKSVALALVLMGVTTLSRGQTSCAPVDPFGRMFAADIRPEVTRTNVPKFEAAREAAFAFGSVRFR